MLTDILKALLLGAILGLVGACYWQVLGLDALMTN